MEITTIGVDLAKNVFQVHAMNAHGKTVVRKRLSREKYLTFFANLSPCLVAIEACFEQFLGAASQGPGARRPPDQPAVRKALREDQQE